MNQHPQPRWPKGLKVTAIRSAWFGKIGSLPPGLDLRQASRSLGEPYGVVRRWAVEFGYRFPDLRRTVEPAQWDQVDWSCRDARIARDLGVTRECVRLARKARGIGPSAAQSATRNFAEFIRRGRDRMHGLLVEEVIHHSGTDLPYHVVRRILREQGVQAHEPHSTLREIDWRLPNRDLGMIWRTSPRYIANLRARLAVGPARWNARRNGLHENREYRIVLSEEKRKARHLKTQVRPAGADPALPEAALA